MKKLILVFVAIAIAAGAYAQADSTSKKMGQPDKNRTNYEKNQNRDLNTNQNRDMNNQKVQNNPVDKSNTDGLVMQNGKIMQVKNGQTTLVDREMTLSNGTKIMSDGTYIKKDGSKTMLKEGQHMDMSGNLIETNKDKNMYLVPDSTRKNNNN